MTRIRIDEGRCIGSGNCENAAPEVFRLGELGVAEILDTEPDPERDRRVRGAVLGCPTGAIVLVED